MTTSVDNSVTSPGLTLTNIEVNNPQAPHSTMKSWIGGFYETMPPLPVDHHSNFNSAHIKTSNMQLDVHCLDFKNKVMEAKVSYEFAKVKPSAKELIFDTTNLDFESIQVNGNPVSYYFEKTPEYKPDALHITLGDAEKGTVTISYKTSPDASGLFWIDAQYTDGKKHPILFTQAEPTDGASWLPGPHSPQVRLKYKLSVNTGHADRMAIASAQNNVNYPHSDGKYPDLEMEIPIPLYLLGIAVGQFAYQAYDNRCGVYAETCKIEEVGSSFNFLPEYMKKAEEICGEYQWDTYRPVLLPLSYPYGAMEHACASFLGGDSIDRPYVLAHELSHSWAGNWITNATWLQLYLNEGLTTYIEAKIIESCIGEEYARLVLKARYNSCQDDIKRLLKANRKEATQLVGEPNSNPPQITAIPYSKGSLFFGMLENAIGKDNFARFIKDYMCAFSQQSMGTKRLLAFLAQWLEEEAICSDFDQFKIQHQIEEWLYGSDIPSNAPKIESRLLDEINENAKLFLADEDVSGTVVKWDKQMQFTFLSTIYGKASSVQLERLDKKLHYSESTSNRVQGCWAQCCSKAHYLTPTISEMIISYVIARNSITTAASICRELVKTEEGRELVKQILLRGEERLFPITRKSIEDVLKG